MRFAFVLLPSVLYAAAFSQQTRPQTPRITLDVVVTPKNGVPVAGLRKDDFTVLDNKAGQPILTFNALGGPEAPVEVVLVIDAVNATYEDLGYERLQIDKFLRANGGHLAHPLSLAIFTDSGTQIQQGQSNDGNALSASLDQATIGLRQIRSSAGMEGAQEQLQLSLAALEKLAARESTRPGRKIVLWVSPGWPLLSGPEMQMTPKQQQQLFSEIQGISNQLRRGSITLYSINPLGAGQSVGALNYYEGFLKGVAKPNQVALGDLGLQVIAVQSGGQALSADNDVSRLLERCMADTEAYYELSFDAPPHEHPNEYHQVEIKISKPGLTARTRTGYYSAP